MRIISKFNDYYDNIQGYGIDPGLIYPRTSTESDIGKMFWSEKRFEFIHKNLVKSPALHEGGLAHSVIIVGFCGKIYPVIRIQDTTRSPTLGYNHSPDCYAYTADQIVAWIKQLNRRSPADVNNILARFVSPKGSRSGRHNLGPHTYLPDFCYDSVDKLFTTLSGHDGLADYFTELNVPVFTFGGFRTNNWSNLGWTTKAIQTIHPNLSDVSFQRKIDPFTAYQELSMYIGGVLGMRPPYMIEISDDIVKRDSKGFDDLSFKTRPGTKQKRKHRDK